MYKTEHKQNCLHWFQVHLEFYWRSFRTESSRPFLGSCQTSEPRLGEILSPVSIPLTWVQSRNHANARVNKSRTQQLMMCETRIHTLYWSAWLSEIGSDTPSFSPLNAPFISKFHSCLNQMVDVLELDLFSSIAVFQFPRSYLTSRLVAYEQHGSKTFSRGLFWKQDSDATILHSCCGVPCGINNTVTGPDAWSLLTKLQSPRISHRNRLRSA